MAVSAVVYGTDGLVLSASSYQVLSLGGGILALVLIPVLLWARARHAVNA